MSDFERLAAFGVDESPVRAEAILMRLAAAGASLERFPQRGRIPPELRSVGDKTWREIQELPWRIVYRILAGRVEIHGVLDGRRDLADLLLQRLLAVP